MKCVCTLIFLLMGAVAAHAQTPVPQADTVDPVQQGDPTVRHLPPRTDYTDDRRPMRLEALPAPVKRAVENHSSIDKPEDVAIYHDEKLDTYTVEVDKAGEKATYRFDAEGQPIMKE